MIATMIKVDSGFYIPKLDGFDDIKEDVIEVEIKILNKNSYKKQLKDVIVEKYEEKRKNQINSKIDPALVEEFRKKYNLHNSLEEFLGSF